MERFGVSMPAGLQAAFDKRLRKKGYHNRSEAIRDIVRDYLVEGEWEDARAPVVGTITLVYGHGLRELSHVLTDLQHQFHQAVICASHVHLDAHNCLEVIVAKGSAKQLQTIAERLISTRGVKHGKLVCTTTGELLE